MTIVTGAVRPLVVTLAAASALVVPFAAGANAPTGRHVAEHHTDGTARASAAADPSETAAYRALPRIRGQVGPAATISVNKVRVVKGRYKIVVQDESSAHSWHITGPGGVDRKTSVSDTGRWVWRVRLRPGSYTVFCDVHPTTMTTSLRVTTD